MRKLLIACIAAAACALPLAACNTVAFDAPPAPVISVSADTQEQLAKRLYDVELAYAVAADTYLAAVSRGQLTGDTKQTVKSALQTAARALEVARDIRRGAVAGNFADQLASATQAIASARKLLPAR